MVKKMRVVDFFCGAGGFSEGFRQMGFELVFALDNWQPAVDTHLLNHPECPCPNMDILDLKDEDTINKIVPDSEVIVGSPPCVAFSGSNKAGKADKTLGIKLIETMLRVVAVKQKKGVLKYWCLENVPNSGKFIKKEYTWKELGIKGQGVLKIPISNVLNAADYGAPQGRKRFVCGKYPIPKKTHPTKKEQLTVKKVFESLGNPLSSAIPEKVTDPCYGFEIKGSELTDHFYDTRVEEYEWSRAKRLKVDHGFMGKMAFPEDEKRPSRTVMATRSASTRESMIFQAYEKGKKAGYRLPTIREVASFMSFPILYQFQAGNESSKYKLIGNAVCCKMSTALAKAIKEESKKK